MAEYSFLALAATLMPIIIAPLAHFIARIPKIGNSLAKATCVITSYATLATVLFLASIVMKNGPIKGSLSTTNLPLGDITLTFYVDELALIPTVFFALFASIALTYSIKYLSPENRYRPVPETFNKGFSFMLLFLGSLVGCCFSSNMIFFLLFWEMTSICSFILVGFWPEDQKCKAAAFKTFVMLHIGTFSLLIGTIAIHPIVRTWEIHDWSQNLIVNHPVLPIVVLLFFIGILPKAVQFPLHTWLPNATVTATPVTVYIHAGFLLPLYTLSRFFGQIFLPYINATHVLPSPLTVLFGNINMWTLVISLTGAITSIIAPLFALLENESKKVAAYISISAVGGTIMALGFATPLGIAAGLLSMVSHVLFTAINFLVLGAVIFRVGKTSMDYMGGLSSYMPITAAIGTLGTLSAAGFPLLGYFTAMWLGIHAAMELNAPAFITLLFLSSVLKIAAILRMTNTIFFGKPIDYKRRITEPPVLMIISMLLLSACLSVLGVYPQILLNSLIIPAVNRLQPSSGLMLMSIDIILKSGFWSPLLSTLIFLLYLGIIATTIYVTSKRGAVHIERTFIKRDEAFKPFLCGEDTHLLDRAQSDHFYHVLVRTLRIDAICHSINVDRFYNTLATFFYNFCRKILHLDIQQNYFVAVLAFIAGAVIIVIIAILGV